jgi:peptide/nickel transport system permease protein/oligopeptide transport system permease protein
MPVYLLGLILILIFAVEFHWLPAAGNRDGFRSIILPSLTIGAFSMALIARMTRSSALEEMSKDYVTAARAKGLNKRRVILRHVLRNALIPVVTVIGLQFGYLLGGSILTETIFAWPGLGRLLTQSLFSRDYPMVQGLVIVFAACFIAVNLLVDILYGYIDPRIRNR